MEKWRARVSEGGGAPARASRRRKISSETSVIQQKIGPENELANLPCPVFKHTHRLYRHLRNLPRHKAATLARPSSEQRPRKLRQQKQPWQSL